MAAICCSNQLRRRRSRSIHTSTLLSLVAVVAVSCGSCATKSFVRSEVGAQNDKVATMSQAFEESQERLRSAEQRIGELDAKAGSATQAVVLANRELAEVRRELQETREALAQARNQSASAAREQLPSALPRPTHRYDFKTGLVTSGGSEPLEAVHARLEQALRRANIDEYATYTIQEGGFAIIAKLECIDDRGRPRRANNRWCVHASAAESLFDILKSLFFVEPGRYRVIAFVVSESPLEFGSTTLTADAADLLSTGASTAFPTSLKGQTASAHARATALVYEFVRQSYDASAVFLPKSSIGPVAHLAGASLWSAQELR